MQMILSFFIENIVSDQWTTELHAASGLKMQAVLSNPSDIFILTNKLLGKKVSVLNFFVSKLNFCTFFCQASLISRKILLNRVCFQSNY